MADRCVRLAVPSRMALSATPGMSPPHLKAVIFDVRLANTPDVNHDGTNANVDTFQVGGVVCRSPLLAIAAYEREHGIPNDYINCAMYRCHLFNY